MSNARRVTFATKSPRWLGVACHRRAIHANPKFTRPSRSTLPPQPQPSAASDDGTRTLRLRKHGNRSLPLPPLMDPIAIEAKERHTKPKLDPEEQAKTAFQEELEANPYAAALASPVRLCNVTKARLPSHFLLPFSTTYATPDPLPASGVEPTQPEPEAIKLQPTVVPYSASANHASGAPTGSSSYVLNRRSVLDRLNQKKNWTATVTVRMQEAHSKKLSRKRVRVGDEWAWDSQMPDRVLEKLRKEVVLRLNQISMTDFAELMFPIEQLQDVTNNPVAAILTFASSESLSGLNAEELYPVYQLPELLGEHFTTVSSMDGTTEASSNLAILLHTRNSRLLLALDRLRMYVRPRDASHDM